MALTLTLLLASTSKELSRFVLCLVLYCSKLLPPSNGSLSTNAVVYDTIVNVSCNPGFAFNDKNLTKILFCQHPAVWNDTVHSCEGDGFEFFSVELLKLSSHFITHILCSMNFISKWNLFPRMCEGNSQLQLVGRSP